MRRQLATLLRRIADRLYPSAVITMNVRFNEPNANGEILAKEAFDGVFLMNKPVFKPIEMTPELEERIRIALKEWKR